jgi:hypothetical protein
MELAILGVDVHVWLGIVPDACLHFCASNVLLRPDLGRGNEKHGLRELSSGFMRIVYAAILGDIAQGLLVASLEYLLQGSIIAILVIAGSILQDCVSRRGKRHGIHHALQQLRIH